MTNDREADELEQLLLHLKSTRGFDFTAYKRASLRRRIEKRMREAGVSGFGEYTDYLEVHPEEFAALFNTVLINVTGFFRDPPAWEYLAREIVPRIVDAKGPADQIRIWSAACASGEEAYTLAIIFAEAVGIDAFKERVKIYATDVDEEALSEARQAVYTAKQVQEVPDEYRERYFERAAGDRLAFRKDLRRSVIFGRHDLVQDAPISRIDLVVSRNVLMYFNADVQARVIARLHFALRQSGFLFLGKAETLFTQQTFVPVELKWRIFTKVARSSARDRILPLTLPPEDVAHRVSDHARVRDAASEAGPVAQLVIDAGGVIIQVNEPMRDLFSLSTRDIGRPLQDLEVSYRPIDLRSPIAQAAAERRGVTMRDVRLEQAGNELRWLDIQVIPLIDPPAGMIGTKIVFADVTRFRQLQQELEQSKNELETAYEELQSTNEELETTNEELQSTIEELETTNEELQSTNEELETMNEELQSTNEELETVNTEMAERSEQLDQVNRFRESVLESFSFAVIVLDRSLNVAAWNDKATDLWGLRADEVRGRQLYSLDIGLPVGLLAEPIRACLAERRSSEIVVQATNRTGRTITCEVRCMPMSEQDETYGGVILSMEDIDNLPPARKGWVARRGGVVISMDGGESQAPES